MNLILDYSIRSVVLAIILLPFFGWWLLAMQHPYQIPVPCDATDYGCRVDAIDAHTTP